MATVKRMRFQFRLSLLLTVVTILCFAFAYPRFAAALLGLLAGTLFALAVFVLVFYYPVVWIVSWFRKSKTNERREGRSAK